METPKECSPSFQPRPSGLGKNAQQRQAACVQIPVSPLHLFAGATIRKYCRLGALNSCS